MTTVKNTKVEANLANVAKIIAEISEYAKANGYRFDGQPLSEVASNGLQFDSKSKMKVCSNYLTALDRKITMSLSNKFLHFMWRKVFASSGPVPKVEYSERELSIKAARKEWKKIQAEADELLKKYKELKFGFYTAK